MALKEFYLGSVGPLLYDDEDTYPDGVTLQTGAKFDQIILDAAATEANHAVRLSELPTGTLPNGSITGDIVRWNETSHVWEVKSEPLAFNGIVLTPALAALADAIGAMYFKSDTKAVMVCTEV